MEAFENSCDTYSDVGFSEQLESEILPYFRALLATTDKVREVIVALVISQVEETAAKVLAVCSSAVTDSHQQHNIIKLPINLWRQILAIAN